MKKILFCRGMLLALLLAMPLSACSQARPAETEVEQVILETMGTRAEVPEVPAETDREAVVSRIKEIDFTVREYPVDTERYDDRADQIYKEAFFQVISNQLPLRYDDNGAVYYRNLLRGMYGVTDDEFIEYVVKAAEYHYLDFDGDGLPELVIDSAIDGPCIFKYNQEEERAELYMGYFSGGHLLGSGQLYCHNAGSANQSSYFYTVLEENGEFRQINFMTYADYNEEQEDWNRYYEVSFDELEEVPVDEETWNDITKDFFAMTKQGILPVTFEEVFGDCSSYKGRRPASHEEAVLAYSEFLADMQGEVYYALADSSGDGVPELHVQDGQNVNIYTYQNGNLFLWKIEQTISDTGRYNPLESGAYVYSSSIFGEREFYSYFQLEPSASETGLVRFGRKDLDGNGVYDDSDEYEFNDEACTGNVWMEKTRKYLYTDENGEEQIRGKVQWIAAGGFDGR